MHGGWAALATYAAKFGASTLYAVSYVRDALGRIKQKTETVQSDTKTTEYGYDQACGLKPPPDTADALLSLLRGLTELVATSSPTSGAPLG